MSRYLDRGLTDGLPVIPPSGEAVANFIAASGRPAGDALGTFAFRTAPMTVKDVAVNAVMAGCLPDYMPNVITAFELLVQQPETNHMSQSTGGFLPWFIVNGPIRNQVRLNCRAGLFGPGTRANATIGRAIRLGLINLAGAVAGKADRATLGSAYKYTCVTGEDEERSPWAPLHSEFRFEPADSTVMMLKGRQPRHLSHHLSSRPEQLLNAVAEELSRVRLFTSANVHPGEAPTLGRGGASAKPSSSLATTTATSFGTLGGPGVIFRTTCFRASVAPLGSCARPTFVASVTSVLRIRMRPGSHSAQAPRTS